MPPVGGGGAEGRGARAGIRRANFHQKVQYWKQICSHWHAENQRKADFWDLVTNCLTLIVSILALVSFTLGASEPTSPCDDVPSECYVSRAAAVLRDSCGGPADCDAASFGDEEQEESADAGLAGWLSLAAGVIGLVASALPTGLDKVFCYKQRAEAFGSAAHELELIAFEVEAKDREAGSRRIGDEVWEELEKKLAAVLQDLPVLTEEKKEDATKHEGLRKPQGPLPASLVPYREPLVEILHITQEEDKRWLDGDIEVLLDQHDVQIERTLLRNLREKSRAKYPAYVPTKMAEEDVLKRIEDKLDNLDIRILPPQSGALDDDTHDVLQRARIYLNQPGVGTDTSMRSFTLSPKRPEPQPEPEPQHEAAADYSRKELIAKMCNEFEFESGWETKCQECWDSHKIWKPQWKCADHEPDQGRISTSGQGGQGV